MTSLAKSSMHKLGKSGRETKARAQKTAKRVGSGFKKAAGVTSKYGASALGLYDLARPFLGLIPGSEKTLGAFDVARNVVGLAGGERYYSPMQKSMSQFNDGGASVQLQSQLNIDNAEGEDALVPVSAGYTQFTPGERRKTMHPTSYPGGPSIFPTPSRHFPNSGTNANWFTDPRGNYSGQTDYRGAPGFFASSYGANAAPNARGYSSLALGSSASLRNPSVYSPQYRTQFDRGLPAYGEPSSYYGAPDYDYTEDDGLF